MALWRDLSLQLHKIYDTVYLFPYNKSDQLEIMVCSFFLIKFMPRRARSCRRQVYRDIPVPQIKAESDNYQHSTHSQKCKKIRV